MKSFSVVKCLPVVVMLLCTAALGAGGSGRYEAVFVDGTRLCGEKVTGWGRKPISPRLDDTPLLDAKRPLRWLANRTLKTWSPKHSDSYIEFVGGDRIVGRIEGVGAGDGIYVPTHLLFTPTSKLTQPLTRAGAKVQTALRILPERIERVVFRSDMRRRLQPGTLYYLSGKQVRFGRLRWRNESVVLLLKDGMSEVRMSEISEIHLPQIDPWLAYYQVLSVLSPDCGSRIMRIETTDGLIATSSALRFDVAEYTTPAQQASVAARGKHLTGQLGAIEARRAKTQQEFDKAQATYNQQLAEATKHFQAAQKAHEKSISDMKASIVALQKSNDAEHAKKRDELARKLESASRKVEERLRKAPPNRRDQIRKTLANQQAQLRKSNAQALKNDRQRLDRRVTQKQKALDRLLQTTASQRESRSRHRKTGNESAKRNLDRATQRYEAFLASVEFMRKQLAQARDGGATWSHIIQPVWTLDPLWIPFRNIRMRWSSAPTQVPLCIIRPESTINPPLLQNRTNCSFTGGPLIGGDRNYAWGFAVHAYSELRFPIPTCAKAFRGQVGLDPAAGPGGCAIARLHLGSTKNKPAYESPLLIGSKKCVDTGLVALQTSNRAPKLLVLQADPADRNATPGTDPLNIRDKLNWLDPRLELDLAGLQKQVRRQTVELFGASGQWTLVLDRSGVYKWTNYFNKQSASENPRFWTMLQAEKRPVKLRREMTIAPDDKWLTVQLGLPGGEDPKPQDVILQVDGRKILPRNIPIKQVWRNRPAALAFSLADYAGKKVTIELTQSPNGKPLHWQAVCLAPEAPEEYRLVDAMKRAGKNDMRISYELGQALQSSQMSSGEKLAAMEISRLGGVVNFRPTRSATVTVDKLSSILIGREWTGGDKAFIKATETFKKIPGLKSMLITQESGISSDAIAKFKTHFPRLKVSRVITRVASPKGGAYRPVTLRNSSKREVIILWVDHEAVLKFSSTKIVQPAQEIKRNSYIGVTYEAHYVRKEYVSSEDYRFSEPVSSFVVVENGVWDIKPGVGSD